MQLAWHAWVWLSGAWRHVCEGTDVAVVHRRLLLEYPRARCRERALTGGGMPTWRGG